MTPKTKTCFKCHVEKPITEYYVHPAMGDGRLNKCKECAKRDVQENYRANIEHYKEYERGRAMLPHRIEMRETYLKTLEGKAAIRRARVRFVERNPAKRAAHIATGNAIRDGRLTRQPCEVCGELKAQAHHDDYSKPLDVRWLCSTHHAEWHRSNTPKCPKQDQAA